MSASISTVAGGLLRMSRLHIDRCVCFQRSFAALKDVAVRTGATSLEVLQEETEFGLACRMCHPYVRAMLKTGAVVFHEILEDDE